ncbi:hypothetical protein AWENTII_004774 [Aspergillus wentii]
MGCEELLQQELTCVRRFCPCLFRFFLLLNFLLTDGLFPEPLTFAASSRLSVNFPSVSGPFIGAPVLDGLQASLCCDFSLAYHTFSSPQPFVSSRIYWYLEYSFVN